MWDLIQRITAMLFRGSRVKPEDVQSVRASQSQPENEPTPEQVATKLTDGELRLEALGVRLDVLLRNGNGNGNSH